MLPGRAKRDEKLSVQTKRRQIITDAFFRVWRGRLDRFPQFLQRVALFLGQRLKVFLDCLRFGGRRFAFHSLVARRIYQSTAAIQATPTLAALKGNKTVTKVCWNFLVRSCCWRETGGNSTQRRDCMRVIRASKLLVFLSVPMLFIATSRADTYSWQNLQSDIAGVASHTDRNLVNPWGLTASSTGANGIIWVSDNGAGVATLYRQDGTALSLVVTIPGRDDH